MTLGLGTTSTGQFSTTLLMEPYRLWSGAEGGEAFPLVTTFPAQAGAAPSPAGLLPPADPLAFPSGGAATAALPVNALGIRYVPYSGDARIDALLDGGRAWAAGTVTFSFPDSAYDYEYPYGAFNEPWQPGFGQVSGQQIGAVWAVYEGVVSRANVTGFGSVEAVTNLDLALAGADYADIRIAQTGVPVAPAWSYRLTDAPYGGDIWFVTGVPGYDFRNPILGDYFYFGHIHEPLHALGLKDGSLPGEDYKVLPYEWDSLEFTACSYRSYVGASASNYVNETYGFPQTPMMLDIAALQYLYGADWGTNAAATTYRWDPATGEMFVDGVGQGRPGANRVFLTIWDAGGTDTYDMSNYGNGVMIDLAPGRWSITSNEQRVRLSADGSHLAQGTVYNALQYAGDIRSLIENAIGGEASDAIFGNDAANALRGNGGADTMSGGAGNDTLDGGTGGDHMTGGTGDDLFAVDSYADLVIELADGGRDTVLTSITLALPDQVENLILAGGSEIDGYGNPLANVITGNAAANHLAGFDGDDTLAGGDGADLMDGGAGADSLDGGGGGDSMVGGAGNDRYVVNSGLDRVLEVAGQGRDAVFSSISLNLFAEVEDLVLTGGAPLNANGNALANAITGNAGANRLAGGSGDDTLIGAEGIDTLIGGNGADLLDGGDGGDSMAGGYGNDRYVVGSGLDRVLEVAGQGRDLVLSSISLNLFAEVEDLTLTGSLSLDGNGNAAANVLTGNAGANRLRGLGGNDTLIGGEGNDTLDGGVGADSMAGGYGDDVFIVDNSLDRLWEAPGEGFDRVLSAISWILPAGVEALTLTGIAAIHGTGNELHNILTGNGAANRLDGGAGNDTIDGGLGADTMSGGTGDDWYVVNSGLDRVVELAGEGREHVLSSVSLTLFAEVEDLTLTGLASLNANGNALDNVIFGNPGANRLLGGLGNDSLYGGFGTADGNDTLIGGAGNDLLDGGFGIDSMVGGAGDDTYSVQDALDQVVEAPGGGRDLVYSSVSLTLYAEVEDVTLIGPDALSAYGNALGNFMRGNDAPNRLEGRDGNDLLDGGGGGDTLVGGLGDDRFMVRDGLDQVVEAAGEGRDLVIATVSFTLPAEIEDLVLSGYGLNGTGNALANLIIGNVGMNRLIGGEGDDTLDGVANADTLEGGSGADLLSGGYNSVMTGDAGNDVLVATAGLATLSGGEGADTFRFLSAFGGNRIEDFAAGDVIEVSRAAFGDLLPLGPLAPENFSSLGIAIGSAPQFVYSCVLGSIGTLFWDADGAGSAAARSIAVMAGGPALTAADIVVIT